MDVATAALVTTVIGGAAEVARSLGYELAKSTLNALRQRRPGDASTDALQEVVIAQTAVSGPLSAAKLEELALSTQQLPSADALAATTSGVAANADRARAIRNERLRQAQLSFNVAIALLVVGTGIVFIGIAFMLFDNISAAAITSGSGVATEIFGALVFAFYKETNNRVDAVAAELNYLERAQVGLQIVGGIADGPSRDQAMTNLAQELMRGHQ